MFKLLDPSGCTYHDDKTFAYNLPERGRKWSKPTAHPEPAEPDGKACGSGRLHLMNHLDAQYAPTNWWPWWARGIGEIGGDEEKTAYAAVELRRIDRHVFWRCLRLGWGKGRNLSGADLYGADLRGANLSEAYLSVANLRWANLSEANLRVANLSEANLSGADLRRANLSGANLYGAILRGANLYGAILEGANLYGAILEGAYLRVAIWNEYTRWPEGFNPPEKP